MLRGVSLFALQNAKMEHTERVYVCKKAQHCPTDRLTKEPLWKRPKPSTIDWISFLLPLFSPTFHIYFSSCFLTSLHIFLRSGSSLSKRQATDKQPNINIHIHTRIHSNQCAMQLCLFQSPTKLKFKQMPFYSTTHIAPYSIRCLNRISLFSLSLLSKRVKIIRC